MFVIIGILIIVGFITIVVFILSLFFGGEDPYERELAEMDRHDELLEALHNKHQSNNTLNIVDARSVQFHEHKYNEVETNKQNLNNRNKRIRQAQSNIDKNENI